MPLAAAATINHRHTTDHSPADLVWCCSRQDGDGTDDDIGRWNAALKALGRGAKVGCGRGGEYLLEKVLQVWAREAGRAVSTSRMLDWCYPRF